MNDYLRYGHLGGLIKYKMKHPKKYSIFHQQNSIS